MDLACSYTLDNYLRRCQSHIHTGLSNLCMGTGLELHSMNCTTLQHLIATTWHFDELDGYLSMMEIEVLCKRTCGGHSPETR